MKINNFFTIDQLSAFLLASSEDAIENLQTEKLLGNIFHLLGSISYVVWKNSNKNY